MAVSYTHLDVYRRQDSNLSLKAKGLLSMMLSLPDEWNYTTRGLRSEQEKLEEEIKDVRDQNSKLQVCCLSFVNGFTGNPELGMSL